MKYTIQKYTKDRAKELGLFVQPSSNKKFKIDIFDEDGNFMFRGGAMGYSDYPTYIETHGKQYADQRRKLYYKRHLKEVQDPGSRGSIIAYLLW